MEEEEFPIEGCVIVSKIERTKFVATPSGVQFALEGVCKTMANIGDVGVLVWRNDPVMGVYFMKDQLAQDWSQTLEPTKG